MVKIVEVDNRRLKKEFIKFPWKVYTGNVNWVPPLYMDMKEILNEKKHPFYDYGEMKLFLAYKNNEIVGRIASILNPLYNEHHPGKTGFFGFFECLNEQIVANALLDRVHDELKKEGIDILHGPASPSANYDYGLLVDGFDDPPKIMMTYNPPYYEALLLNWGLQKRVDLWAYKLDRESVLNNKKLTRLVEVVKKRSQIKLIPIDLKNLREEIKKIKHIYNTAWEPNFGHVPFTDKEIELLASQLKLIADPSLIFFGYVNGELVGIAAAIRDINFIIKQMDGKLFPFNFLKMFTQKKKINWLRVLILGILPKFQKKGFDAVFYHELIAASAKLGLNYGEASWILEDNEMMNRGMKLVNGKVYKTYRIYEKDI